MIKVHRSVWASVKHDLPPDGVDVLVYFKRPHGLPSPYEVARCVVVEENDTGLMGPWWFGDGNRFPIPAGSSDAPSHWMDLPEAP